jgi:hypothetical protein
MSEAELWSAWRLWMALATVIILVAASLLIAIWLIARSILAEAGRALAAAERIREQTSSIWALQTTNEVAAGLVETTQEIERTARTLASALESHAGAGGTR